MKSKRLSSRRKKDQLTQSGLAPRLAAYSATALAALALAPAAGAQVINITNFDYNSLTGTTTPPSLVFASSHKERLFFTAGPLQGKLFAHFKSNGGYASVFPINSGDVFNAQRFYKGTLLNGLTSAGKLHALDRFVSGTLSGQFIPSANGQATGYLGFKAAKNGKTYYGWLNVKVTGNGISLPNSISLTDNSSHPGIFGAYENKADALSNNFSAGQIAVVPEPADAAFGLGLLAFGAAGVREMRRRRKMQKAQC